MNHEKLNCYQEILRLCQEARQISQSLERGYGYLSDQLKRAISLSLLNLAEGNSRKGYKERKRFFEISRASLAESAAIFDLFLAFGLIPSKKHRELKEIMIRNYAILFKL